MRTGKCITDGNRNLIFHTLKKMLTAKSWALAIVRSEKSERRAC